MNIVDIYNYVKKHGDTKVVIGSGSQYTIPRDGLSKYLKDNFFIDDVFEVVEDTGVSSPFTVKKWLEAEVSSLKIVNIYGKDFEIDDSMYSYIFIEEDGSCFACEYKPSSSNTTFYNHGDYRYLGRVEYEGDWKQSVIEI